MGEGGSLKVTAGDHGKHIQMSWPSDNRKKVWWAKPEMSSRQNESFYFSLVSRLGRMQTCCFDCTLLFEVTWKVKSLDNRCLTLFSSSCHTTTPKAFDIWTAGDFASEKSTLRNHLCIFFSYITLQFLRGRLARCTVLSCSRQSPPAGIMHALLQADYPNKSQITLRGRMQRCLMRVYQTQLQMTVGFFQNRLSDFQL